MAHSPAVGSTAAGSTRARMRTRQACQPCRKRRRKCDGQLPCGQCSFYQYDCVFGKPDSDPFNRQSHVNDQDIDQQSQIRSGGHGAGETTQRSERHAGASPGRSSNAAQAQHQHLELVGDHRDQPIDTHDNLGPRVIHDPPIRFFDERKGRYCGRHSTVAFPHLVRTLVGSSAHLRLHSYGWNINLRSELEPPGWSSIRRVITYQEIEKYSSVFLEAIGPVYELFDPPSYHERSRLYWVSRTDPSPDFEAFVAGVVALGSLFSREGSMAERQLVEYAKTILDIGCNYAPGRLSIDQSAAWVLRTIYLRCTTRPHLAWFASCASMHVAEGVGLHIVQAASAHDVNNAKLRILHCAILLNGIISAEYGRSRVRIDMPRGVIPDTVPPSQKLALAHTLFALEGPHLGTDRLQCLQRINQLQTKHSVLQLHKVDVAMHWYRRYVHGVGYASLAHDEHKILVDLLRDALSNVSGLVASKFPWWNVLSTPFQSLLVLLSIDSDDSLALVPQAMKCLEGTVDTFSASLTTEALEAAQHLVKALKEKKMTQAQHLRDGDRIDNATGVGNMNDMIPATGDMFLGGTMDNWLEMFDLDDDHSFLWGTNA